MSALECVQEAVPRLLPNRGDLTVELGMELDLANFHCILY